ncbi:ShlB/FhaC/HecB family hemolysin secretion/activation protein [Gammaproteobacteria bacterium]
MKTCIYILFFILIFRAEIPLSIAQEEVESVAAKSNPDVVRFDITRFQVEGNSLLSNIELESLLAPYAGSSRDFSDVQHALEALESTYHSRGYTATQVYLPEQELASGVVRLAIIEARIHEVQIEGNRYFNTENLRASLPNLHEGEPPNLNDLSASLRAANENPAKKLTLEMQATEKDDLVDARIKVQDEKPWRIGLSLDNTGTPQSGRAHYGISFQHANIANLDQILNLQYTTSSDGPGVSIYGIGYHIPVYQFGDSIDLFGGYSDVDSGSINGSPITGRGSVFGVRYNQDLGRKDDYLHRLSYGIDYRYYQGIQLPGNIEVVHPVTVLPLSFGYTGTWTLPTLTAAFSIIAFHNVPAGAHGGDNDFLTAIRITRPTTDASADYSGVRYTANLNYTLPSNWLLRGILSGQYTHEALIPGEQIGLAGSNAVRGFPERDVATDRGRFINLESYTPELCAGILGSNCRLLVFLDHGWGYSQGNGGVSIGSAGIGLRLTIGKTLNLEMNGAQVLKSGGTQQKDDRFLHFQVGVNF